MTKPDFFIVGAPKCGTTAMTFYLMQHPNITFGFRSEFLEKDVKESMQNPDVQLASLKDLLFFGSDLKLRSQRLNMQEYLSCFPESKGTIFGDVSIWYLFSQLAAKEIKNHNPNAKIIIMLRHPVDLLVSQHSQMVFRGYEPIIDFRKALAAEDRRKKGIELPIHIPLKETLMYRDIVSFSSQVERYLSVFNPSNVFILLLDDLKRDPEKTYKKILKFLGVDSSFQVKLKVVNPNKQIKSRALQRLYMNPPFIFQKIVQVLIPEKLRPEIIQYLTRWNTVFKPRVPMDTDLRNQLIREFKPEIRKLESIICRDLSRWLE